MPQKRRVKTAKRRVSDRQLNTILAALRVLQANPLLFPEEFGALRPLTKIGIDRLCEALNLGKVTL